MRQTENLADLGELVALELDYFEDCRNIMQLLRDSWPTNLASTNREHLLHRSRLNASKQFGDEDRANATKASKKIVSNVNTSCITEIHDPFSEQQVVSSLPIVSNMLCKPEGTGAVRLCISKSQSDLEIPATPPRLRRLYTESALQHLQKQVKANFSFDAERDGELSIRTGDILLVIEEVSEGWWVGQIVDAQCRALSDKGLFPSVYCSPHESDCRRPSLPNRTSQFFDHTNSVQGALRAATFPRSNTASSGPLNNKTRSIPPPIPSKKKPPPPPPSAGKSMRSLSSQ